MNKSIKDIVDHIDTLIDSVIAIISDTFRLFFVLFAQALFVVIAWMLFSVTVERLITQDIRYSTVIVVFTSRFLIKPFLRVPHIVTLTINAGKVFTTINAYLALMP